MNWKTKEQKILEGTFRQDREPKSNVKSSTRPLSKVPPLPKYHYLDEVGRYYYQVICKILIAQNRLTSTELTLILDLADLYQTLNEARKQRKELGIMLELTNKVGEVYYTKNPALTIIRETSDLIIKYSSQLGITPYTQSRLNIVVQTDNPADDYLNSRPHE